MSEKPDYVRRGGCADCLKVWSRERDKLLRQIDALQRDNTKLRETLRARQGLAGKVS